MPRLRNCIEIALAVFCLACSKPQKTPSVKTPINVNATQFKALTISTKPSNLLYRIDGQGSYQGNQSVTLKKGWYTITVTDPCYKTTTVRVDVANQDNMIHLNGRKRLGLIKLSITDGAGKRAKGDVLIDKVLYGNGSGTYQVPLCSRILEVEAGMYSGEALLDLKEDRKVPYSIGLTKRGLLTQKQIEEVIEKNMPAIHQCFFDKRIKSDGDLRLFFGIRTDGTVYFSKIRYSTIADNDVNTCIVEESKKWIFPKPRGGGSVKV